MAEGTDGYFPQPVPVSGNADLERYLSEELHRISAELLALDADAGGMIDFRTNGVNKFGRNTDVDQVEETIWDGGGTVQYTPGSANWSTTADITHVVSNNTGDNGLDIEVQGLDANWDEVTQTVTLGTPATQAVTLTTPLIRVYRMKNPTGTAYSGTVQCGVGFTLNSFGNPQLKAQITNGFEQTLMAVYTVPAGKTAYMTKLRASLNRSNNNGACDIVMYARSEGGVFRVQHTVSLQTAGSTFAEVEFSPYPEYAEKTDIIVTGQGSNNNHDVSASFDLILE